MKSYTEHLQIVNTFMNLRNYRCCTVLDREYGLTHPNFKGFELREKQNRIHPDDYRRCFGEPQIIRIPDNTFEYPFNAQLTPA
jgi:hypothetical protein